MNRIAYKGVPTWTNSRGELFLFESLTQPTDPICIGTVADGFYLDLKERLQNRLDNMRDKLTKRLRKPDAAPGKNEKGSAKASK
jgi:hypothetical protein